MSKEHAYAYEAGYRDGSIHYELEHCPACKNVADLQEALVENDKLRELVRGLRYCANEAHGHGRCSVRFVDEYVTYCPLYDVDSGTARCEALLRELGVEVNDG